MGLPSVEFEELFTLKYILLISYVAGKNRDWYFGHKCAHKADRGRPTLNDDERFQNGLVRDLKIRIYTEQV